MHRGYIKIWRKLEDSGLLQMHGTLALFVYMLMQASHKPIRYGMETVDRGQFISGRHKLSEAVGLSEQQLRTCIEKLHKLEMITSKPTNKYTLYTIVNYGQYQSCEDVTNQQINQQVTNNQPTSNQQVTTIQEHKHINTKEENTSATSVAGEIYSKAFLSFWDMYPNRKNKGAAFKAFKKIKPAEYPAVKDGLTAKKKSDDWLKDNGKFIPHPASWLNARGWEDETTSAPVMLVCPNGFPFSDWMKASQQEKAEIMNRHG